MKHKFRLRGLKYLLVLFATLALVLMPVTSVSAATTAGVTIDATPTFMSITLNVSSFNFSMVVADTDENTDPGYFGVTNDSTVNINVTIQCNSTWEGGASDWTYGAPAEDQGQLKASNGTGAYGITILTASAVELHTTGVAGADFVFELELDTPTSFTFGNAQSCQVRLTATAV